MKPCLLLYALFVSIVEGFKKYGLNISSYRSPLVLKALAQDISYSTEKTRKSIEGDGSSKDKILFERFLSYNDGTYDNSSENFPHSYMLFSETAKTREERRLKRRNEKKQEKLLRSFGHSYPSTHTQAPPPARWLYFNQPNLGRIPSFPPIAELQRFCRKKIEYIRVDYTNGNARNRNRTCSARRIDEYATWANRVLRNVLDFYQVLCRRPYERNVVGLSVAIYERECKAKRVVAPQEQVILTPPRLKEVKNAKKRKESSDTLPCRFFVNGRKRRFMRKKIQRPWPVKLFPTLRMPLPSLNTADYVQSSPPRNAKLRHKSRRVRLAKTLISRVKGYAASIAYRARQRRSSTGIFKIAAAKSRFARPLSASVRKSSSPFPESNASGVERLLGPLKMLKNDLLAASAAYAKAAGNAATAFLAQETERRAIAFMDQLLDVGDELILTHLRRVQIMLRQIPQLTPQNPALTIVGMPNVGKSALARKLSTSTSPSKPYPFSTTRLYQGHFTYHSENWEGEQSDEKIHTAKSDTRQRQEKQLAYQILDGPPLLYRSDSDRNLFELLTLATLLYWPTGVLYVFDLSASDVEILKQMKLREQLKAQFPRRPWVDVLAKQDLIDPAKIDFFKMKYANNEGTDAIVSVSCVDEHGMFVRELQQARGTVQLLLDSLSNVFTKMLEA